MVRGPGHFSRNQLQQQLDEVQAQRLRERERKEREAGVRRR